MRSMNAVKCTKPPADPGADKPPQPKHRRRWGALALRAIRLALAQRHRTADLVTQSYNRIATGYDASLIEAIIEARLQ